MSAFWLPLRPLKLRVVAVMQTSPSDKNPTLGWHMPHPGVITCALGTLASNASATVTIETTVIAAGGLTNSAQASANETDLVPANNAASFVVNSFFHPTITAQQTQSVSFIGASYVYKFQ